MFKERRVVDLIKKTKINLRRNTVELQEKLQLYLTLEEENK